MLRQLILKQNYLIPLLPSVRRIPPSTGIDPIHLFEMLKPQEEYPDKEYDKVYTHPNLVVRWNRIDPRCTKEGRRHLVMDLLKELESVPKERENDPDNQQTQMLNKNTIWARFN